MLDLLGFHFHLQLLPQFHLVYVGNMHAVRVQNVILGYIWKATRADLFLLFDPF